MNIYNSKKSKEEAVQNNEADDVQIENETVEEESVANHTKKKYYCIVVDKRKNVILNSKGEPYFLTVEEGSAPEWPREWSQDVVRNAQLDKELRVELDEIPANLTKNDRKKVKRQNREAAKAKLLKIGKERIAAAKEMQNSVKDKKIKENAEDIIVSASKENIMPINNTMRDEKTEKGDVTSIIEKKDADPVDLSKIITCVEKNKDQFSKDIYELIKVINENDSENKKYIEECSKRICNDVVKEISQKTLKHAENIEKCVNESSKDFGGSQNKLFSKIKTMETHVADFKEAVEGIEGKLHRMDQLDKITELLRDKGLTISREIPSVNTDEEDIINLVRYSQKITEQLGYAARELLRKQEIFKSQEENNANEQRIMEQKIAKAHSEGIEEGKKEFIKQLLSKYENVDTIRESDNNYVHAIWNLLIELGISIDREGCYEKGNEIELTDADIEKMRGIYSKLEDAGKYKVTRTGLKFQNEILYKAVFEKIETVDVKVPEGEEDKIINKEEDGPKATSKEAN